MSDTQGTNKGVPHELNTSINHLAMLLKHLPKNLPLDPETSLLNFGLDQDEIKEEGFGFAFNRCMEIAFQTYNDPTVKLNERGTRCAAMIQLFRDMAKKMSPSDRDFHLKRWISRVTDSAKAAGAKIPSKQRAVSPPQRSTSISSHTKEINRAPSGPSPRATHCPAGRQESKEDTVVNLVSDDECDKKKPSPSPSPIVIPIHPTTVAQATPGAAASVANKKRALSPVHSEPDSRTTGGIAKRQRTLEEFGARRATMTEVLAAQQRITKKYGLDLEEMAKKEKIEKERKLQRKRDLGRRRVQRFRDKKKTSLRANAKAALLGYDLLDSENQFTKSNIAEISRPGSTWKKERNGKKGGVLQKKYSRVNWYHPFLWAHINRVAPLVGWSPKLICSTLKRDFPQFFSGLHRGTVSKWISKNNKRRWSTATTRNVERRHALAGSGRAGVLTPYPELIDEIKKTLTGYRKSGIAINRFLTRSVILAILQEKQPELLLKFKCSESFVDQFLESIMDWTVRRGTRAAAHIPANMPELCERTLFRIVHLLNFYDIPPELIIGMDQTGIMILMTHNKTYAQKGSKQVDVTARDEKRAYTLCVATTPTGTILPFQQVWSGKTRGSLPSAAANGMAEANELGFDFSSADSKKKTSHFSTLKTMKEWMANILKPYVLDQIKQNSLPNDQKAILLIDCYPVHTSEEFRMHVFKEYPNIFLLFIPANCTGVFQPADVGLNRVLKHFLRQRALEFLVESHSAQIKTGLTPEQVKITTSLPVLRDASVKPVVDLFNFLSGSSGRELIRKSWEMSKVYDLNLGVECLTSKKTKALCRLYISNDKTLQEEIKAKLGTETMELVMAPIESETDFEAEDNDDDDGITSEIPLEAVIRNELGIDVEVPQIMTDRFCVPAETIDMVNGHLHPGSLTEDIWAYRDDGLAWEDLVDTQ